MKNKQQTQNNSQKPTANLRHFFSTKSFAEICTLQAQRPTASNTTLCLSPPLKRSTGRTSQHAKNNKNTSTMIATIRRPPPAPISEVSAIAVRRTIDFDRCDPVM
jgi:hypothetical protein